MNPSSWSWPSARPRTTVALVMLVSSAAVYLPFRGSMDKVHRYWDGPPYMYIAKTLYDVPQEHPFAGHGLARNYFANHLPAYPMLIRALTPLTFGSYPAAMILATLLSATAAAVLFYEVLKAYALVVSPIWTAILFSFLPPRWLIYHSVGATEPLFFCFVFAAFLALKRERPGGVAAFVALASLTRFTGVLLVPIFALIYAERREWRRSALMGLGGLGLAGLFTFYHFVFGDFFAYFTWNAAHQSSMVAAPFAKLFAYAGTKQFHSTELFVWMFLAYGAGTLALWRHRGVFIYAAVYFLFCTLISHPDLPRYFLMLAPFSLLVGFDAVLSRPAVRWALPLAVFLSYVYAWGYIPYNMVGKGPYAELLRVLAAP